MSILLDTICFVKYNIAKCIVGDHPGIQILDRAEYMTTGKGGSEQCKE